MAAPFKTQTHEFSFRAQSPERPEPTPKGYVRIKAKWKSMQASPEKNQFLLDLTMVSKGDLRKDIGGFKGGPQAGNTSTLRDMSPFRSVSRLVKEQLNVHKTSRDSQLKYDLSQSVYDRQKAWRNQV